MEQHGEELRVGEMAVNGLVVALLKGIEHARRAQLLERRVNLGLRFMGI